MNIIQLSPDKELSFKRPFSSVVKQLLTITNTSSSSYVAFKIKTTAPKQYCVRPNSGKLAPRESLQIQVLLQAMKEDPSEDFKCKDKFLIQSIKVPHDVATLEGDALLSRLNELWAQVDVLKKENPSAVTDMMDEVKLRVSFLSASSIPQPTPVISNFDNESTFSSHTANNNPAAFIHDNASNGMMGANESVSPVSSQRGAGIRRPTGQSAAPEESHPHISSTASQYGMSNMNGEEKPEKELKEAKDMIKKLTMACDGYRSEIERLNVLRQRKTGVSPTGATTMDNAPTFTQQYPQPGVPIQMVAIIGFIAFLLGVLFF